MRPETLLKVGELSHRAGITVRALHHYDALGLLRPSRRSPSGHRLYTEADLARLLCIRLLQQLGLSLDDIRTCLRGGAESPPLPELLDRHLAQQRARLAEAEALCTRLERVRDLLATQAGATAGDLLEALETIAMFENYYTKDQLDALKARAEHLGPDRIRAVEAEWPKLIAAMREHLQAGASPTDPAVQALARRWQELVEMFTGGDPGIRASLERMYEGEPAAREQQGLDPELMAFVGKAIEAGRG